MSPLSILTPTLIGKPYLSWHTNGGDCMVEPLSSGIGQQLNSSVRLQATYTVSVPLHGQNISP